ncbi:MAG: M13 family metallopeptidase [Actinomycetota bacterium]|nr:M13 family metallopeptidase [Actinomycetota bacterium]
MALNAMDRDSSVDPGVDFYRFANGGWLAANPIPAGYGAWGSFEEVQTRNETLIHELLKQAVDQPANELDRKLGDYFASGMDVDTIESAGIAPIEPMLNAIDPLMSHKEVLEFLPRLHDFGVAALFMWGVDVDHDDSTRNLLWLVPAGLGLPERESYFADSEAATSLRLAYVDHVRAQLINVNTPETEAGALAPGILEFETRLAEQHMKAEERRDLDRTLNRFSIDALGELAPDLGLPQYLIGVGAAQAQSVNVENIEYLQQLNAIVESTDLATLRGYLKFRVVSACASALPARIEDEAFAFYGRRVGGQTEPKERYKRVIAALGSDMGEAIGQRFVDETFSPAAKDRALEMVAEIIEEMRRSLQTRTWMTEETRAQALIKLDAFGVKIGYPDQWRDWSGLEITRDSYATNRLNATRFELDRERAKIAAPVDENDWEMPPHIVNAYFHPTRNEIVFPAGILQPPMFDADADDAVNYGGIGTVIAHEITHGFDDQGRRFDANGAFVDWWHEEDQEHFTALADRLVDQFDEYVIVDDVHVNGRLTLGENIADLGGIALAQRAHSRISVGSPTIDGLTPGQRFFLANATLWRANMSEELKRTLAQIDPHSPRDIRVAGPFSNLDAFQEAFALADDAPIMRSKEERIEIW